MLHTLFWLAFWLIIITWLGYPIFLYLAKNLVRKSKRILPKNQSKKLLSILIAAHNEESVIEQRLKNLITVAPTDFEMEIIVMSDNSTDKTVALSRTLTEDYPFISVFETKNERGKVAAHNQGVPKAKGEIIVFTDAETKFSSTFLDQIGHAFDDPDVGFASGALSWQNPSKGVTGESFSLYWRYEMLLRELETSLGIHALGTGACSAVRKELYRPIAAVADQDFITPLDAVLQNYKSVFIPEAMAYDYVAQDTKREFQARIRMTAKNFLNTFTHWGLKSYFRFPLVSLGLIFHKLLRWFTPYFALILLLTGTFLMISSMATLPISILTVMAWFFVFYALLGAFWPTLPAAGFFWSFLLTNIAFAIGVFKALTNQVPTAFK